MTITDLKILKEPTDALVDVRISMGYSHGKGAYILYRGDLDKVKKAMALLNEVFQLQDKEAPFNTLKPNKPNE